MQHQMKGVYIRKVCTHHECVHCFSFEVAHATYHILLCMYAQYVRMYVRIQMVCTYVSIHHMHSNNRIEVTAVTHLHWGLLLIFWCQQVIGVQVAEEGGGTVQWIRPDHLWNALVVQVHHFAQAHRSHWLLVNLGIQRIVLVGLQLVLVSSGLVKMTLIPGLALWYQWHWMYQQYPACFHPVFTVDDKYSWKLYIRHKYACTYTCTHVLYICTYVCIRISQCTFIWYICTVYI